MLVPCLELSTAHIPPAVLVQADGGRLWDNIPELPRCQPHEYGWIVFLGDSEFDSEAPEWFHPVLAFARDASAFLVNFDTDAEVCPTIPHYN